MPTPHRLVPARSSDDDTRRSPSPPPSASRSPIRVFIASFSFFLALSLCWILATPLAGVPDEPSHIIKAAAVVRGQFSGDSIVEQGQTVQVRVPQWVADSFFLPCFIGHVDFTPNCDHPPVSNSSELVDALTTAGNYNPVYYAVVGLPSLVMNGRVGLFAMRSASALLSAVFVGAMFSALAGLRRRRFTLAAAAVGLTPMVFFLAGSVNPNSLEFATAGALFANLLRLFDRSTDERGSGPWVAWVTASAALLANTKALSLLWLAVTVCVVLVLAPPASLRRVFSRPTTWVGAVLIGASTVFALWWVISAGSLTSAPFGGAGTSFIHGAEVQVNRTFEYAQGLVGEFGWLDNPAPLGALWFWGTLVGGLVIAGLALARRRERIALLIALAAVLGLPVYLQAAVVHDQGYIWQGRYILALFIVLLLAAGVALDRRFDQPGANANANAITKRLLGTLLGLAVFAEVWSFVSALRRNVIGLGPDLYWVDMVTHPGWQPPGGWIPLTVVYTALLTLAAVVVLRWCTNRSGDLPSTPQDVAASPDAEHHVRQRRSSRVNSGDTSSS